MFLGYIDKQHRAVMGYEPFSFLIYLMSFQKSYVSL